MTTDDPDDCITRLLADAANGDDDARDRLWSRVYRDLRGVASAMAHRDRGDALIQPTSLVHEAYLRLLGGDAIRVPDRAYFFRAAAMAMRRILIEHARRRLHRGTTAASDLGLSMESLIGASNHRGAAQGQSDPVDPLELDALDAALDALETAHPTAWNVVMHRFFAGLSVDDTATSLGLAPRTVDRQWAFGRAWLYDRLRDDRTQS